MDDTPVATTTPSAPATGGMEPPRIALIAAVAKNSVIGAGNGLPWKLPADLRHFRALTMGHRVVMGRRTWQSLGRPLPGRENVIVSRDPALLAPGCTVVANVAGAFVDGTLPRPIFCIGGATLYEQALPAAEALYLTEIDADFDGDTRMPPIARDEWRESSRIHEIDPETGLHYAFVHYVRIKPATADTGMRFASSA